MIVTACFSLLSIVAASRVAVPTPAPVAESIALGAPRDPHDPQNPPSLQNPQNPSASRGDVEWKTAPDGDRGFGAGRSLHDIVRILRSTAEEDRATIAALYKLESELRILLALVTDRYKDQGYFALLGPAADSGLDVLGAAFRTRQRDAPTELARGGPEAELLARMLVDARFRSRLRVVEGWEFEAADLKGGLALLFANLDGFADLKDHEAELIARRIDLAACRLRAMRLDLEALREKPGSQSSDAVWGQDLERLLMLMRSNDAERREKELPAILERLDQREEGMCSALFTTRQAEEFQSLFAQRAASITSAEKMLPTIRELIPDTPEGQKASSEVQALPKNRRYAYAARSGAEALGFDPMNEELNYLVGLATDFNFGAIESHRWFDRFLALRGIRSHEYKSYADRKLTREEKHALDSIQQLVPKGK
jgi:hypothetical protein